MLEKAYSILYKIVLYPSGTETAPQLESLHHEHTGLLTKENCCSPLPWSPSSLHLGHTLEKTFLVVSYAKIPVLLQKRLSGISEALHELSLILHWSLSIWPAEVPCTTGDNTQR